jgi:hypothetical protein
MSPDQSLDFPLKIVESAGLARTQEPVRFGVPLPRGKASDTTCLRLEDQQGRALPLQAHTLARWPDGTVQWALIDTQISAEPGEQLQLRLRQGVAGYSGRVLHVADSAAALDVDTGVAQFRIPRTGARLVESVRVAGSEQLGPEGLAILFRDGRNRPRQASIAVARIEEQGPLRASVVVEGVIEGTDRRRPLEFKARLVFGAGSPVLEIELRIRNPRRAMHRGGLWDLGDPGSQLIRELALVLAPGAPATRLHWSCEEGGGAQEAEDLSDCVLYQDSSGGERWNSPNHLAADGQLAVSFRGYQLRGAGAVEQQTGYRATPCFELEAGDSTIACAVEGFWQNFPKALRWKDNRLQAALFPCETRCPTELQGGEQKRHRVWFAFGARGAASAEIARRRQPLQAILDPHAVEASRAIRGFAAPRADDDPRYAAYVDTIIAGQHSFFSGREVIDEYGWRNFGDMYADHEAVNHKSADPFVSHYNNQYDVVLGMLLQGLRSGGAPWFELARDLARHVADIDIYHTRDDKPAYNGGLFWHSDHHLPAGLATHRTYSRLNAKGSYGGGPDNEQNYTSGLLTWHFLTGDPDAAEAVQSLADFVIAMDDGNRTVFRYLDRGPTGNASKTVSVDYHGPGRGAGNSINALLDAYWLTRERRYLSKAEELIQRCIHPRDDIAALGLVEPEWRWSYLVFLQALGKYLSMKRESGETGHEFCYARDSLLHYAAWMLEHERPYSEQLHKVLLPTETWSAQDVRKACVLIAAAEYCPNESLAQQMRAAGARYFHRCLDDLLAFPTAHHVRPRVLLSVYGIERGLDAETAGAAAGIAGRDAQAASPPSGFQSQRRRISNLLRRWGFHGSRQ